MSRKNKPVRLTTAQAVGRIDAMVELLQHEIKSALWIEATMEAANDYIVGNPGIPFDSNEIYNAIAQSLMITLTLNVSRMFDRGNKGRKANDRDISSIPLLVRLLKQKRCRKVLVERAMGWSEDGSLSNVFALDCERAIDRAVAAHQSISTSGTGRHALRQLKDMRNRTLAHSLLIGSRKHPKYNDLFRLVDAARDVMAGALIASDGADHQLKELEDHHRVEAKLFWERALTALKSN